MLRSAVWSVGLMLVVANLAAAQEQPGPEHKQLAAFEGKWDAVMIFGDTKSKCKATYKKILGGMYVESDFEGEILGAKFQGRGLDGYNLKTKKYVSIWADSMSSAPMHMEGDYDEKTKTVTMTGETLNPQGKPQKFKAVTTVADADHFTFKMFMVSAEGKDELGFTIEYTRSK